MDHNVVVTDRGGDRILFELDDINSIVWNRVRDDVSTATISLSSHDAEVQGERLNRLLRGTGRYELVIWDGPHRRWEGPITLFGDSADGVSIQARDVGHYMRNAAMRSAWDNRYPNIGLVTTRARQILEAELARFEAPTAPSVPSINVVPHIVEHLNPTGPRTSSFTHPYQMTVFEHIDGMAARSGLDYTAVGRAIHLWDSRKPAMGFTPTATRGDFLGDLYISAYGMELSTRVTATDGQGKFGSVGGEDPFYGLVERIVTIETEEGGTTPTTAEFRSQASRNLTDRNPTPLQVRVPDNSTIDPRGVLSIETLIPGVYVPLSINFYGQDIVQMQKLQSMRVREDSTGREVAVTLYPASQDDEPEDDE